MDKVEKNGFQYSMIHRICGITYPSKMKDSLACSLQTLGLRFRSAAMEPRLIRGTNFVERRLFSERCCSLVSTLASYSERFCANLGAESRLRFCVVFLSALQVTGQCVKLGLHHDRFLPLARSHTKPPPSSFIYNS